MLRNTFVATAGRLGLLVTLAACESGGTGAEPVGSGTILIQNRASEPITEVRIFRCGATNAGEPRIALGDYIQPNTERAFTRIPLGCTGIRVSLLRGFADAEVRVRDGQTEVVTIAANNLRTNSVREDDHALAVPK
jgi:hypothetical protein